MKTYIINLKREKKRKLFLILSIKKTNINLDIQWVEAIDGSNLNESYIKDNFDIKKYNQLNFWVITPEEVACALSHRKCYENLVNSANSYALVLEDDVLITDMTILKESIVQEYLNSNKPIIFLLSNIFYISKVEAKVNKIKICKVFDSQLAHAYLINKAAAKKILEKKPFYKADDWGKIRKLGINIYGFKPHIVDNNTIQNFKSSINIGRQGVYSFTLKKYFIFKLNHLKKFYYKSLQKFLLD